MGGHSKAGDIDLPKVLLQIPRVELFYKWEATTRQLRLAMFITDPDFSFFPHGFNVSLISLQSSCNPRAAPFLTSSRKRRKNIVIMKHFEPFTAFSSTTPCRRFRLHCFGVWNRCPASGQFRRYKECHFLSVQDREAPHQHCMYCRPLCCCFRQSPSPSPLSLVESNIYSFMNSQ